jgi:hypothetical protein
LRRNGTDGNGTDGNGTDAGADCPAEEEEEALPPGNATIVLTIRMPYSIQDFDEAKQASFKQAVASIANVNESTIGKSCADGFDLTRTSGGREIEQ